jgi:RNA polymerase sigma-70 factor (ECF subfamily)
VETARWFAEEVQPHESSLRHWLRGRFPALRDVDDLVQESYARLLRARRRGQVAHARSYLFATARNAACDLARRERVAAIEGVADIETLSVYEDRPDVAESLSHEQEIEILAEAIQALPKRCRLVLKLRKLRGLSHREIARRLGISEHTVNAQLARGLAQCRAFLRERGVE